MHKVIIDTDPGIDDAQAIAFAVAHPEIDLLGLTTVYGNADIDITTNNACAVLELLGAKTTTVARGAEHPLSIDRFPAPDFVHGADAMGNVILKAKSDNLSALSAAEYLVSAADKCPGEITVIAIGPLTNLALALKIDPKLPEKLKQLIVMGGTVSAQGNVSPVAEANFINDPHAADFVCQQHWPLSIIGLDVTMKIALTDDHFKTLQEHAGSVGEFLWQSSRFYVDFYSSLENAISDQRACAMHDASAVVYLVRPDLFECITGAARVATSGIAMGQLVASQGSESYLLSHWQDLPKSNMAMKVDSQAVLECFVQTLIAHYRNS